LQTPQPGAEPVAAPEPAPAHPEVDPPATAPATVQSSDAAVDTDQQIKPATAAHSGRMSAAEALSVFRAQAQAQSEPRSDRDAD
ncbi:MAG: hypothetical protein Q4P32_00770, partial [Micrococcales bacterium]|nr:hypothetical protein [Micrococcales bacterium]